MPDKPRIKYTIKYKLSGHRENRYFLSAQRLPDEDSSNPILDLIFSVQTIDDDKKRHHYLLTAKDNRTTKGNTYPHQSMVCPIDHKPSRVISLCHSSKKAINQQYEQAVLTFRKSLTELLWINIKGLNFPEISIEDDSDAKQTGKKRINSILKNYSDLTRFLSKKKFKDYELDQAKGLIFDAIYQEKSGLVLTIQDFEKLSLSNLEIINKSTSS